MTTYIIADVAGRYDELMLLIEQFEKPSTIIQLGDTIDRGPKSKEVVEYFRAHPEHIVLKGNHEDLMVNDHETWLFNGGTATLRSFGVKSPAEMPDDVIEWAKNLPLSIIVEEGGKKFFVSHAPPETPDDPWHEEPRILWNRIDPPRDPNYELLIYGHNSRMKWTEELVDNKLVKYAVCIDDCKHDCLTAIELPSMKIIQQPYLPKEIK